MSLLDSQALRTLQEELTLAQADFAARFPGEPQARQPVQVLYGGAHLFKADTAQKLGVLAQKALRTFAPEPASLARALGLEEAVAAKVYPRLVDKLEREPIEDLRIDFEDGYGHRSDEEEDGHAVLAGRELAKGLQEQRLPPFIGVRIKPMSAELGVRAIRTLSLFLRAAGQLPSGFVVTLPKVVSVRQVELFVDALELLERGLHLPELKVEFMVEAAQGLLDADGRALLPQLQAAARGRLQAAHFGAYDYTASLDITAAQQRLSHPACDFARTQMKLAFAGTGVFLSDGATTVMPVPPHRGDKLSAAQREENERVVHGAWRAAADDLRHSLSQGFYQGWDLHPAQLVSRYGALFGFFQASLAPATERLSNFVRALGQATLSGEVFDDAATGQGLLNFFLRGHGCGALTWDEVAATGLSREELAGRSFAAIARARRVSRAG